MSKHSPLHPFNEEYVENPFSEEATQFDYGEEEQTVDPDQVRELGEALREVMTWLVMGDRDSKGYGQTVMRKTIAMVWVLRPELFDGKPLSTIAREKGVNVYKQSLRRQAIKFAERFGVKGRGQRKRYAKAKS